MKTINYFLSIAIFFLFISISPSCVVQKHDNGKHKGWFKNSNNPHHPNSTNPGHGKSKSAGKSNGKSKGK